MLRASTGSVRWQRYARLSRIAVDRWVPRHDGRRRRRHRRGLPPPDSKDNVVGVGVGKKERGGREIRRIAIRVYVTRKVHVDELPPSRVIGGAIGDCPVDVVEIGEPHASIQIDVPSARMTLNPIQPGCSLGPKGVGLAGTLGAIVTSNGTEFLLSNNHVLSANDSLGFGTEIDQPASVHIGSRPVGSLAMRMGLSLSGTNRVDCALAALAYGVQVSPEILGDVGTLASANPLAPSVGLRVHKTGWASGYTTGKITDVADCLAVGFDTLGCLSFKDVFLVEGNSGPFSKNGDSGALVVDQSSQRAVGLLFAATPTHSVACRIGSVLEYLEVKLKIPVSH